MIFNKFLGTNQFVFDLFLKNKSTSSYVPNILNSVTNTLINNIKVFYPPRIKNTYISKDIPSYLNIQLNPISPSLKTIKIDQYKGYLVNLFEYKNVEDYLKDNLSRRNRKNLFSKLRRLEQNHKIRNKVYYGDLDKSHFDGIFDSFQKLLIKRFREKKTNNRYLSNWEDIKTLSYKKILNKTASLHVIYDDETPITITLNFHLSDIVFSHIQTYHTGYASYNMGDISMLNHLEWCISNNFKVFDLAIGKSSYKEKWCNYEYDFFYHIHYNSKSLISRAIAGTVFLEFKVLRFLRNKGIIGNFINFDKIRYKLRAIKT